MKCFVSLMFLVALLGVNAYDFKDSAFNEHLLNELQTLTEENEADKLTHRSRRQVAAAAPASAESNEDDCPLNYRKEMHCCQGNVAANVQPGQLDAFKNAKKECITQIRADVAGEFFDPFDCELMGKVREKVICVSECVAKKYNGLSETGELQRDNILALLKAQIGGVQWKLDAVEGFVDKCIAEVNERKVAREAEGKSSKTSTGCSLDPLTFQRCMWREYWNGCPLDQRIETPKCINLRGRVAAGDVAFFGKHFLHKYYLDA